MFYLDPHVERDAVFSGQCCASGILVCTIPGVRHASKKSAVTLSNSNDITVGLV